MQSVEIENLQTEINDLQDNYRGVVHDMRFLEDELKKQKAIIKDICETLVGMGK